MVYDLVYQCGVANVFRPGLRRVLQGPYHDCEMFCRGLMEAGCEIKVYHCNNIGDITRCEWHSGPGDTFNEYKHTP
jgi:hypothetical protein